MGLNGKSRLPPKLTSDWMFNRFLNLFISCPVSDSKNATQIQDGDDFRVLISPLSPIKEEEKEEVASVKSEKKVQKKGKVVKKVVKVEVKSNGMDNRYSYLLIF